MRSARHHGSFGALLFGTVLAVASCAVWASVPPAVAQDAAEAAETTAETSETAEAPETSSVVLLAPESVRAEWTAALQIELAARGARVLPGDPPEGATVLQRDAEAQRVAIDEGALAAARVEQSAGGWTLRLIESDAAMARATPVAQQADARTVALIVVSLLDEPRQETPSAVPPPPSGWPAERASDTAAGVALAESQSAQDAPTESVPAETEEESPVPRGAEWSGRIGTGGFGLFNDRRFIPGAMLRGGVGLRARYFEGAILADVGMMVDSLPNNGTELQPLARLCVEAGAAIPLNMALAFHIGGRGCGGIAELRVIDPFDPFGPFGDGGFADDQLGALVSGGGYLAFSTSLSDSSRLYVRADVEAAALQSSMHYGEVLTILSAILSFH